MDPKTFKNIIEPLVIIKFWRGDAYDSNPKVIPIQEKKPCEDCDRMVQDRRVLYLIKDLDTRKPYWTKKCSGCKTNFGKITKK